MGRRRVYYSCKIAPDKEVRNMRCASCGIKIEDDPVWRGDDIYCSEECADIGTMEQEEEYEEKEEEDLSTL